MKILKKYNRHYFSTISLTLFFLSCLFLSGCQQSTSTAQTEIADIETITENTSISETSIISSDIENSNIEETAEVTTIEESTTELNYNELINFNAEYPYMIRINRAQNWTTIYGLDKNGHYSVPYKVFICSTGLYEDSTPVGSFKLGEKYDWRLMVDGTYAQYAIRISGPIMLHSVPYYTQNKNDLEVEEYAKLGSPASLGCIRYNVESIKWIYDNCPEGTIVVIYDSEEEEPLLELPVVTQAKAKGQKAGWDPTDPDKENPWNNKKNKTQKLKKSNVKK